MSLFFENKSYMFDTLKKWKVVVENETNLKMKCLKSDNGDEYRITDFKKYCDGNEVNAWKSSTK